MKGRCFWEMYSARFVTEAGRIFDFGYQSGTIFDISDLSGVGATISTSQGFNQVGETVEGYFVGSVTRQISGKFLQSVNDKKRMMLQVFTIGTSGKLYFNEKFYANCTVKTTPAFGHGDKVRNFALELLFPYPYWLSSDGRVYITGEYIPTFRFPVNYAEPHRFGIKKPSAFTNCFNDGVVAVDFRAEFTSLAAVSNYGIVNAVTLEELKFNDTLTLGERLVCWRENGRLKVTKNGEDAFSLLDDTSELFQMYVGENPIKPIAETGEDDLVVSISFSDTYSGVFDGM